MNDKPYSQACENNKEPILAILKTTFRQTKQVLEIGSGTGQHAVHFAKHLPHIKWQTSDLLVNHSGINQWLDEYQIYNIEHPIEIDLNESWILPTSIKTVDGIFTANTLHIVSWPLVVKFFEGIATNLISNGTLCIYGPFNYGGKFTSNSNENFDLWLKNRNNNSGIRDIEAIVKLASLAGLKLVNDHTMPANNRLLVFVRN